MMQSLRIRGGFDLRLLQLENPAKTVFEKVTLLPKIKCGVELSRQMFPHFDAKRLWQFMKFADFVQGRFVKRATDHPRFISIIKEIVFTEVFQPDQSLVRVVVINPRRPDLMGLQELRDLHVMPVFFAIPVVLHQDQRLLSGAANAIKFAVRAAFLDWRDFYPINVEPREVESRLMEKQLGFHDSKVDVPMIPCDSFSGADNTTKQLGFGSNL